MGCLLVEFVEELFDFFLSFAIGYGDREAFGQDQPDQLLFAEPFAMEFESRVTVAITALGSIADDGSPVFFEIPWVAAYRTDGNTQAAGDGLTAHETPAAQLTVQPVTAFQMVHRENYKKTTFFLKVPPFVTRRK